MCRYSGGCRWRLRAQRDGCAWEYRSCTATDAEESSNHVLWYTLTSLLLILGRGRSPYLYSCGNLYLCKHRTFIIVYGKMFNCIIYKYTNVFSTMITYSLPIFNYYKNVNCNLFRNLTKVTTLTVYL
uniref:Uncharacterized protein n=1 Tax=Schizaphis graminum TaxID=13262 RepID=A0A2S2NQH9_SCHGA